MTSKRFLKVSSEPQVVTSFPNSGRLISRGTSGKTEVSEVEKISHVLEGHFVEDAGVVLDLRDEFEEKTIRYVVMECRSLICGEGMTMGHWLAVKKVLEEELWEFGRLKEELAFAERKCGLVEGKLREAAEPAKGEVSENRVMACAMLLQESRMKRDNLQARVTMVIDEFVGQIMEPFVTLEVAEELELRLRGVFGGI